MTEQKRCNSCGEMKDVSEFQKHGQNPDGSVRYKARCKECVRVNDAARKAAQRAEMTPEQRREARVEADKNYEGTDKAKERYKRYNATRP